MPAAFRRLCVETSIFSDGLSLVDQPPSGGCVLKPDVAVRHGNTHRPAAFGRLRVETAAKAGCFYAAIRQPPSGGCVLKLKAGYQGFKGVRASHLRAAEC